MVREELLKGSRPTKARLPLAGGKLRATLVAGDALVRHQGRPPDRSPIGARLHAAIELVDQGWRRAACLPAAGAERARLQVQSQPSREALESKLRWSVLLAQIGSGPLLRITKVLGQGPKGIAIRVHGPCPGKKKRDVAPNGRVSRSLA